MNPTAAFTELEWLQHWYTEQCNDEWEHSWGVSINTLDNPGWALDIDLTGTNLAQLTFEPKEFSDDTEGGWYFVKVEDNKFIGRAGPLLLTKLILEFMAFADREGQKQPVGDAQ